MAQVQESTIDIPETLEQIPPMEGKGNYSTGLQEIHMFIGQINPDLAQVALSQMLAQEYNNTHPLRDDPKFKPLKMCHLELVFRSLEDGVYSESPVNVLQSSMYVMYDSMQEVLLETQRQEAFFKSHEFPVLRIKVETTVDSVRGLPETNADVPENYPYYEQHYRLANSDQAPISQDKIEQIKMIIRGLEREFQIPIPLSYNLLKHEQDGGVCHVYLNTRFRNIGTTELIQNIDAVKQAINGSGLLQVEKVILELVIVDTMPEMDQGWIDFRKGEMEGYLAHEPAV